MTPLRALPLVLVWLSLPFAAAAVPTLDQSYGDPAHPQGAGLYAPTSSEWSRAQSFTVGFSGTLARIGLSLRTCCPDQDPNPEPYPLEPLEIQVVRTVGGVPSLDPADVLATELVSQATIDALRQPATGYSWLEVDLAAQPLVGAGSQLAIVLVRYPLPGLSLDSGYGPYYWRGHEEEDAVPAKTYLGGELWSRQNDGAWLAGELPYEDLFFATWVEPASVPEPGASVVAGLALFALIRRRRAILAE